MFTRSILSAILLHAAIGQLCVMPVGFAEAMPEFHAEHLQMVMPPAEPMSPAHCDSCISVRLQLAGQWHEQTSCTGHCLAQAGGARTMNVTGGELQVMAPAAAAGGDWLPLFESPVTSVALAPPFASHTQTVILRV